MELVLTQNKETKNGVIRFADADGHNIYLKPSEVNALGSPKSIKVSISAQ
jgi:hypothetical protein